MKRKLIVIAVAVSVMLTACTKVKIEIGDPTPTPAPITVETEGPTEEPTPSPQETLTPAEPEVTEPPAEITTAPPAEITPTPGSSAWPEHPLTQSYLSEEAKAMLSQQETDYRKVYWNVEYSLPNMDGVIVSIAPYVKNEMNYLVVGITNLYNKDITLYAEGYAMDAKKNDIGKLVIFEDAIRTGQTVIRQVYCDGDPTGAIHWDTAEIREPSGKSVYWEADWGLRSDSEGYKIDYQIVSSEIMKPGYVWTLMLNSTGRVVECYEDFNDNAGSTVSGTINTYKDSIEGAVDVAFFANPLRAS